MNEYSIQNVLHTHCWKRNHTMIVPNVKSGDFEADLFSLTQSGYLNEYEIKISTSDYIADFKKKTKHKRLSSGFSSWNILPNYFWYVVPDDLLDEAFIPSYAGYITVAHNYATIVKRAPLIHKGKITADDKIKILNNFNNRNWFKRKQQ